MTTLTKKSRSDTVRQRRSSQSSSEATPQTSRTSNRRSTGTSRKSYRPETIYLPVEPQTRRTMRQAQDISAVHSVSKSRQIYGKTINQMAVAPKANRRDTRRNGYDLAFSLGGTAIHAPTLSLPTLGPRWISAGLTVFLVIVLYTMWTANTFRVSAADVVGNQRLQTADVESMLGVIGQPIFNLMPAQIETNLRVAFPDLASVSVQIGFPNHLRVDVVERTPVLAWYQDGKTTWIDSNGVAFQPRGNVQGLIQIAANANPPAIAEDPEKSKYDQPFLSPETVQAIQTLFPQVPEGSPMIYDPKYGMGWQDPRGWSVFFGQGSQDIPMKQKVYQAILDTITQQGIQPTLISVEYLNTPFYK